MSCPIKGTELPACSLEYHCPYWEDREVHHHHDSLFTAAVSQDEMWPTATPSSEERWSWREVLPERGSGDEDRLTAEESEFVPKRPAMFFSGVEESAATEFGIRIKRLSRDKVVVGYQSVVHNHEIYQVPIWGPDRVFIEGWHDHIYKKPISTNSGKGGSYCPMYSERKFVEPKMSLVMHRTNHTIGLAVVNSGTNGDLYLPGRRSNKLYKIRWRLTNKFFVKVEVHIIGWRTIKPAKNASGDFIGSQLIEYALTIGDTVIEKNRVVMWVLKGDKWAVPSFAPLAAFALMNKIPRGDRVIKWKRFQEKKELPKPLTLAAIKARRADTIKVPDYMVDPLPVVVY